MLDQRSIKTHASEYNKNNRAPRLSIYIMLNLTEHEIYLAYE